MLLKRRSLIGSIKKGSFWLTQSTLIQTGIPMEKLQTSPEPWIWLGEEGPKRCLIPELCTLPMHGTHTMTRLVHTVVKQWNISGGDTWLTQAAELVLMGNNNPKNSST